MEMTKERKALEGIKLIILDLDGTIADSIESIRDGVNLAMEKHGFPQRTYEDIRRAIGNGARELIRLSMPAEAAEDAELVDKVFADYHAFYGETYIRCTTCYDGIVSAVLTLRERGYTLAVLSNKQDIYVKALVKQLLPKGSVAMAVGQTDLPRKPDPTVPRMIAESLGFSPIETAMVGDSEVDIMTALNAEMLAVGCSWGYRDRAILAEAGAQVILDEPRELTEFFL